MMARHLEFLVEELSMEAFLNTLPPRLLPEDCTFAVRAFQGKRDLLSKLASRLRAYARWLPPEDRIFVLVDRDDDDCRVLKERLEVAATEAGLPARSQADTRSWKVANRIAIEELEAWYFGDWEAVRSAYPRVSPTIPNNARYRGPDAIRGGTWEAFERILKRRGYFKTGLRKIEAARAIAASIEPGNNRSRSFKQFHDAVVKAVA